MAPVKFDDIPKVATGILDDDYVVSGYVLKTKQKTAFHGTSFSSQVDIFADPKCATPAKVTFAMPKPFGCEHFTVNKLEMDKAGKFKLEAAKGDVLNGLKVEVKSDLKDLNKVMVCKTYNPVPELQAKHDFLVMNPKEFTSEVTYAAGKVTVGAKCSNAILSGGIPDFGLRLLNGPFFCSLMATKGVSTFDAAASFNVNPCVKVAAKCSATQKGFSSGTAGLVCKGLYKAKVCSDGSASIAGKHAIAKGLVLQGGMKYSSKGPTFGLQLSIE